jgi:hypothetical protein
LFIRLPVVPWHDVDHVHEGRHVSVPPTPHGFVAPGVQPCPEQADHDHVPLLQVPVCVPLPQFPHACVVEPPFATWPPLGAVHDWPLHGPHWHVVALHDCVPPLGHVSVVPGAQPCPEQADHDHVPLLHVPVCVPLPQFPHACVVVPPFATWPPLGAVHDWPPHGSHWHVVALHDCVPPLGHVCVVPGAQPCPEQADHDHVPFSHVPVSVPLPQFPHAWVMLAPLATDCPAGPTQVCVSQSPYWHDDEHVRMPPEPSGPHWICAPGMHTAVAGWTQSDHDHTPSLHVPVWTPQ